MENSQCPKCTKQLIVKDNMFHWRGVFFSGLVCEDCNALYDNPKDSFEDHVAKSSKRVKPAGTEEG